MGSEPVIGPPIPCFECGGVRGRHVDGCGVPQRQRVADYKTALANISGAIVGFVADHEYKCRRIAALEAAFVEAIDGYQEWLVFAVNNESISGFRFEAERRKIANLRAVRDGKEASDGE